MSSEYAGTLNLSLTELEQIVRQQQNDLNTTSGTLKSSLQVALNQLMNHLSWFSAHSLQYKRVEIVCAFVEYDTAGGSTRYIMQAYRISRMQLTNGTWISAS